MKNFVKLSRSEMRNVKGGLIEPIPCDQYICMDGKGCPDNCGCGTTPIELPDPDTVSTYCYSVLA
jgi:hypothetical protein